MPIWNSRFKFTERVKRERERQEIDVRLSQNRRKYRGTMEIYAHAFLIFFRTPVCRTMCTIQICTYVHMYRLWEILKGECGWIKSVTENWICLDGDATANFNFLRQQTRKWNFPNEVATQRDNLAKVIQRVRKLKARVFLSIRILLVGLQK